MKKALSIIMVATATMFGGTTAHLYAKAPLKTTQGQKNSGRSYNSQTQYDWIYGTWKCSGTIDMGPYLGGHQKFTTKVIISKSNIKVYYNGKLSYNGHYTIDRGEIRYNQTKGTCDVLTLDISRKRIEFGQGYYYSKVSSANKAVGSQSSNSSSTSGDSYEKVYVSVDQHAEFPGGQAALLQYVASNIKYPASAQEKGIQGRVTVQFVVTKTGSIGEVRVVRGKDPDLDKEAVRLTKSLPRFNPGKMNGVPVNVWYTLPITFKLPEKPTVAQPNSVTF